MFRSRGNRRCGTTTCLRSSSPAEMRSSEQDVRTLRTGSAKSDLFPLAAVGCVFQYDSLARSLL